ncbi:putative uncharacterized protein [Firmicutes bacterium CAG:536]|nr:putative uncharacterized protein [Firmicutes bacterium CAG:536]
MSNTINSANKNLIYDYIKNIDNAIEEFELGIGADDELVELIIKIVKVFEEDIANLKDNLLFKTGTEIIDANTIRAILIKYLADNGIEYIDKDNEKVTNEKRFWNSFICWFENELPNLKLLKGNYLQKDDRNGGRWNLNLDYDYVFTLYRGTCYPDSLKSNTGNIIDIKKFIEIAYKHLIIDSRNCHYKFTKEVNERFKTFKLPYKLQYGIVRKQGYRTTSITDKIINYKMFERKIRFSEDMINSQDLMEKKSALDFIIDALQYLISIHGKGSKRYTELASSVCDDQNGKVYAVIKDELQNLMKISNDYFDIRHNDYLNDAKEKREALNDSQFIEYLYNRVYAMVYILRLKHEDE